MWQIIENKNWENIEASFAWVQDMKGVPQDPIFHAEGDVAIHTKMVLEALLSLPEFQNLKEQEQEILFAAALLHDVEKRSTTKKEIDGRITSRNHARKGEFTARSILYRNIPTPFTIREEIAKLVRFHGLPLWVFEKEDPLKSLLKCSLEVNTKLLSILATADVLGRICPDQKELLYKIDLFKEFCKEQACFGQKRKFKSDLARFQYFHKEDQAPDYLPFDDYHNEVILFSALPGTGKDTYLQKHFPDHPVISLDAIRKQHKISPKDGKAQGKVAHIAKDQAKEYLRKGKAFVWNATNLSSKIRAQLIALFSTYKAKVKIVYLEVPYVDLLKQNRNREEIVPLSILHKMIGKWEVPYIWEAFEITYVVRE